jgi:hypothetical protein
MNTPDAEPGFPSVYKMTWWARLIYFLIAAAFLFIGYKLIEQYCSAPWGKLEVCLLFAVGAPGIGKFCILNPILSRVVLDRDSVTLTGVFGRRSLPRAAVAGYKILKDDGHYIILISADPKMRNLSIPQIYRFDRRWDAWISTLELIPWKRKIHFFGSDYSGK